jgi:hypothetical protein
MENGIAAAISAIADVGAAQARSQTVKSTTCALGGRVAVATCISGRWPVGSRTGAVVRRSGLACFSPFPLGVPQYPNRESGWDRARARPALGGGLPFLLFRLQDGFTVPPWLRFPWPPYNPGQPDFPGPV